MSTPRLLARGPESLFGVDVIQPDPTQDEIRGSMPTGKPFLGPDGLPSVGSLGVLTDNVLGYSMIASLPPDSWTVSTEIWIDVLAPLPTRGSRIHAEGRTARRGSFSAGEMWDDEGRLLAVSRERGRPIDAHVHTLERDVPERPLGVDAPGVMELLGLVPVDEATLLLPVTPSLENPRRMLHGGVSLCAAEVTATWARYQAGANLPTSSVHVVHSRPVPAGSWVEFRAITRHAGRSLWITDVTGIVAGKVAVHARVSAQDGHDPSVDRRS